MVNVGRKRPYAGREYRLLSHVGELYTSYLWSVTRTRRNRVMNAELGVALLLLTWGKLLVTSGRWKIGSDQPKRSANAVW